MKRFLKWVLTVLVVVAVGGLMAFLYFIPPFFSIPSEQYVKDTAAMAVPLPDNMDAAQRAMAERGRYIVMTTGCGDCHTTPGPQGPQASMYMAGGMKTTAQRGGTVVSRNLTSDPDTGLGKVSQDDVLRVLRSGVFRDGRTMAYRHMPWAAFANWTEEDRRAVLAYIRLVPPVRHRIPDPQPNPELSDPSAVEAFFGADYGSAQP